MMTATLINSSARSRSVCEKIHIWTTTAQRDCLCVFVSRYGCCGMSFIRCGSFVKLASRYLVLAVLHISLQHKYNRNCCCCYSYEKPVSARLHPFYMFYKELYSVFRILLYTVTTNI